MKPTLFRIVRFLSAMTFALINISLLFASNYYWFFGLGSFIGLVLGLVWFIAIFNPKYWGELKTHRIRTENNKQHVQTHLCERVNKLRLTSKRLVKQALNEN